MCCGGSHGTRTAARHRFLRGTPVHGADVVTTIDLSTQRAAAEALGNMTGAVVALDPHSGEVVAMVSQPGFDPNAIERVWDTLRQDARAPLLNRAIQSAYPPGSTFKVITAAAALDRGIVDSEAKFQCTTVAQIDALSVDCRNHSHLATLNFREAFAWSCNRTCAHGLIPAVGCAPNSPP